MVCERGKTRGGWWCEDDGEELKDMDEEAEDGSGVIKAGGEAGKGE